MRMVWLYRRVNAFFVNAVRFVVSACGPFVTVARAVCLMLALSHVSLGQNDRGANYPPKIDDAIQRVYKTVGDVQLKLYLFRPKPESRSGSSPAIVFFFGGGWRSGSPAQFEQQARYLSERGLVAILADYRVASRHQVAAVSCVEDAKSAVRWIREHASEFLIDPNRIVAAGGSAGGHLAACTALIESFDASDENSQISSRPNALVLFNPALVLAPAEDDPLLSKIGKLASMQSFAERMGVEPQRLSPYHHVEKSRAVPTIIFHGKVDQTVPFATVEAFHSRCQHVDSPCELVGYDDQPHGFFNFTRKDRTAFKDTLLRTDQFLVSLNYLTGTANVKLIDQLAQAKTEK